MVRSNIGPQRDLIIARLSGGPLARTGVIAGMSGSPVYIDGRLIGAVSYALGIVRDGAHRRHHADWRDDRGHDARRRRRRGPRVAPIPIGADISALASAFAQTLRPARAFVPLAWPEGTAPPAFRRGRFAALRPIALPLSVGGIDGRAAARALSSFDGGGFVLSPDGAGGPAGRAGERGPLRPGDPVGIGLITGDLQFGATGTVTDVDGDARAGLRPSALQRRAGRVSP